MNLIPLSLAQTAEAVAACVRAGRVPLVLGPPGVAKTALGRAIAPVVGRALGCDEYPAEIAILANYDAVDLGGLPVQVGGDVERRLFGAFRRAVERPCLLVLDEFFSTPPSVQGPAARVVLERVAGEQPLHPLTRVIAIANPPEQTPAGVAPAAMLINRVVQLACRPQVGEIARYFRDPAGAGAVLADAAARVVVDAEEYQARREALALELSYTIEARTDLVCFDPPDAAITDGAAFASPRALEAMIDVLAAVDRDGDDELVQAIAHGAIGQTASIVYLAVRKARALLPTVDEVIASPDRCRVPGERERDLQVAAISLLIQTAARDTGAAWVYLDRFPDEMVMAISKPMARLWRGQGPWTASGRKIMQDCLAWSSRLAAGQLDASGNLPTRPRRQPAKAA